MYFVAILKYIEVGVSVMNDGKGVGGGQTATQTSQPPAVRAHGAFTSTCGAHLLSPAPLFLISLCPRAFQVIVCARVHPLSAPPPSPLPYFPSPFLSSPPASPPPLFFLYPTIAELAVLALLLPALPVLSLAPPAR